MVEDLGPPDSADGDPRRRYYRITQKGRRALELEDQRHGVPFDGRTTPESAEDAMTIDERIYGNCCACIPAPSTSVQSRDAGDVQGTAERSRTRYCPSAHLASFLQRASSIWQSWCSERLAGRAGNAAREGNADWKPRLRPQAGVADADPRADVGKLFVIVLMALSIGATTAAGSAS